MAIILPESPGDPPHGRARGSLFYQSAGRTLLRNISKPVDPETILRSKRKATLASAAINWRWVVDATSKTNWTANSKYGDRGQLEYVGIVSATNLAGLALPTFRSADANPDPPGLGQFGYLGSPFLLNLQIQSQPPAGQTRVNYYATPPTPRTSSPSIGDRRLFKSMAFTPNLVNLTADYLAKFGNVSPDGRPIILAIEVIKNAIPADTKLTIATITDGLELASGRGWTSGNPLPRNGTIPISLTPLFGALPPFAPIDIIFTGPDLTTTIPASIPNVTETTGIITDTLGRRRDVDFKFLMSGSDGRSVNLPMGVTITI